jgi:hypothetical protein
MNTFAELITATQSDLNLDATSPLFNETTVKLAINRAYIKAGGLYRWKETEDSKKTSSVANQEYYDYPTNWRPNSVWKLKVDGTDYGDPLAYKDYLYEGENNWPSGLQLAWTSQWRRVFIYPTPLTTGNNNIELWGMKIVDNLVNDADPTIFSYSMPECNEAIVLEAEAILKGKAQEENSGQFRSAQAMSILTIAWGKVTQDQKKYEKTTSFFEVQNFFPDRRPGGYNTRDGSPISNF